MSNTDQGDGKPPFMKQTEVPTDPAQGYDPLHDSFMKRGDVPTDNPGGSVEGGQPHMNVGTERFAGIKQQGAPTDAPGSDAAIDFRMHQAGGTPDAPGTDVEGAQPHMDAGATVEGGQPHMDAGGDTSGWPLAFGSTTHVMTHDADSLYHTFDTPGATVEGGQPHMDTSGGSGGTPTWSAPGNPDRGSSIGLVIGIVLVLVLLLGGGGAVVAAKAGVFGCQFAAGGIATTTGALLAGDTCGTSNTGPLGGTTSTTRAQPTATATAVATATPRPTAVTRPTATPKPTAVIPVPSISITQPANNSTYAVSGTTAPNSGPITFHAAASPGTGASSVTVTWVDSVVGGVDSPLGSGATLSKGLSSNCNGGSNPTTTTHHVTAKAQNNLGGTASATITITVTSGCHF